MLVIVYNLRLAATFSCGTLHSRLRTLDSTLGAQLSAYRISYAIVKQFCRLSLQYTRLSRIICTHLRKDVLLLSLQSAASTDHVCTAFSRTAFHLWLSCTLVCLLATTAQYPYGTYYPDPSPSHFLSPFASIVHRE